MVIILNKKSNGIINLQQVQVQTQQNVSALSLKQKSRYQMSGDYNAGNEGGYDSDFTNQSYESSYVDDDQSDAMGADVDDQSDAMGGDQDAAPLTYLNQHGVPQNWSFYFQSGGLVENIDQEDLDERDVGGNTPLTSAIDCLYDEEPNQMERIQQLIALGVDVNKSSEYPDGGGEFPIEFAYWNGELDLVRTLFQTNEIDLSLTPNLRHQQIQIGGYQIRRQIRRELFQYEIQQMMGPQEEGNNSAASESALESEDEKTDSDDTDSDSSS